MTAKWQKCLGFGLQNWEGNGDHPQKERHKGKHMFPDKRSVELGTSFQYLWGSHRTRLLGCWTFGSVKSVSLSGSLRRPDDHWETQYCICQITSLLAHHTGDMLECSNWRKLKRKQTLTSQKIKQRPRCMRASSQTRCMYWVYTVHQTQFLAKGCTFEVVNSSSSSKKEKEENQPVRPVQFGKCLTPLTLSRLHIVLWEHKGGSQLECVRGQTYGESDTWKGYTFWVEARWGRQGKTCRTEGRISSMWVTVSRPTTLSCGSGHTQKACTLLNYEENTAEWVTLGRHICV